MSGLPSTSATRRRSPINAEPTGHRAVPIVHANPLLVYIELARHALMDNAPLTSPVPQLWIMGGAWALLALVVGFVYEWRKGALEWD